jgi:hypothetical protein
MSTELAVLEVSEKNYPKIYCVGGLDAFYQFAKSEVEGEVPDVLTKPGRDRIASLAAGVSRSKTAVEKPGRAYNKFLKAQPKLIDKELREYCDKMDQLRDDTRAPLTAWEVVKKAEEKQIADTAAYLIKFAADVEEGYRDGELFDLKAKQAEAERQAEINKAAAEAKAKAEQKAAEEIEQSRLDKISAQQREAKAKQDIIDLQAKAKQDEEDRKEEIRVDHHERMVQHIVDCGKGLIGGTPQPFGVLFRELQDKIVIDESFEEFRAAAELAKKEAIQKLKDCQEKQAKDREEAEQQAKRNTDAAAENARQAVLRSQQDEADRIAREKSRLEADKKHTRGVKTKAMNDFIAFGVDPVNAKLAVQALAAGEITGQELKY